MIVLGLIGTKTTFIDRQTGKWIAGCDFLPLDGQVIDANDYLDFAKVAHIFGMSINDGKIQLPDSNQPEMIAKDTIVAATLVGVSYGDPATLLDDIAANPDSYKRYICVKCPEPYLDMKALEIPLKDMRLTR